MVPVCRATASSGSGPSEMVWPPRRCAPACRGSRPSSRCRPSSRRRSRPPRPPPRARRGCPTSTAPTSRCSPSTRPARWTSTRRCTSSGTATGSSCGTRSPTSPPSWHPATRSTSRRNRRGETLYGADSQIPLHPKVLSEGAASLLPDQVRPALLWTIKVDKAGHRSDVHVERALVRSRERLTYEEAQRRIDDGHRVRVAGAAARGRRAADRSGGRPRGRVAAAARAGRRHRRPAVAPRVPRRSSRSSGGTRRSRCSPASPPPR